jgi:hypothetical protein
MNTQKEIILTSKNIEEEFEKNSKKFKKKYIVYAESGEDFQEYIYENGKNVPSGTPIGYETEKGHLTILSDIFYSDFSKYIDSENYFSKIE